MGKFTWDYLMQVCWVLAFLGDLSRMLDGFCITCPQRLNCLQYVCFGWFHDFRCVLLFFPRSLASSFGLVLQIHPKKKFCGLVGMMYFPF